MSDLDNVNTDDILDMTLDDLEDLPTFEPYPAGAHRVLLTLTTKVINDAKSVEADMQLVEHMELANPGDKELKPGAKTSVLCGLGNQWGRGTLKLIAKPIGEMLGVSNINEVIDQTNELECIVVTYKQQDSNDKELYRTKIKSLAVV